MPRRNRVLVHSFKLLKTSNTGAVISDGDRKRGVHASPCVVPKKLFLEKIAPHSRHKPARIHANLRGATTLYGKWKRKSSSVSTKLYNF